jgi:hypothetical protein
VPEETEEFQDVIFEEVPDDEELDDDGDDWEDEDEDGDEE